MQVFDKARRAALVAVTKRHFQSQGWTAGATEAKLCDLVVSKNRLRFILQCVDGSVAHFHDAAKICALSRDISLRLRNNGEILVSVLDSEFDSYSFSSLAERGMAAVRVSELSLITSIERFWSELPLEITPLDLLLLERSIPMILSICERFKAARNMERAIWFYQRTIDATPQFSIIYNRLFDLLYETGDFEGAKKLGTRGLGLSPQDTRLLIAMLKLAKEQDDPAAVEKWRERLEQVPQASGDSVSFLLDRTSSSFSPKLPKQPISKSAGNLGERLRTLLARKR